MSPASGKVPLTVNFTGDGRDNDGIIALYYRYFDEENTSNKLNISDTFLIQNKNNITLTVMYTDEDI